MELYSFALLKSSIIKIFHIPNNSSTEVSNVPILQERVFWGWKPSKNKNIAEPHQNFNLILFKKCNQRLPDDVNSLL